MCGPDCQHDMRPALPRWDLLSTDVDTCLFVSLLLTILVHLVGIYVDALTFDLSGNRYLV